MPGRDEDRDGQDVQMPMTFTFRMHGSIGTITVVPAWPEGGMWIAACSCPGMSWAAARLMIWKLHAQMLTREWFQFVCPEGKADFVSMVVLVALQAAYAPATSLAHARNCTQLKRKCTGLP